jgi:hypothetical protein
VVQAQRSPKLIRVCEADASASNFNLAVPPLLKLEPQPISISLRRYFKGPVKHRHYCIVELDRLRAVGVEAEDAVDPTPSGIVANQRSAHQGVWLSFYGDHHNHCLVPRGCTKILNRILSAVTIYVSSGGGTNTYISVSNNVSHVSVVDDLGEPADRQCLLSVGSVIVVN